MLNKIKIKNLKSLLDIEIVCNKLNLIAGINSSGKSSALQAVLLLSQNIAQEVGLNGDLVNLGDFREVKNAFDEDESIKVEVVDNDGNFVSKCFYPESEKETDSIQYKSNLEVSPNAELLKNSINYKNGHLHYLSCQRVGHLEQYPKNLSLNDFIGYNGEFAINYLLKHRTDNLETSLIMDDSQYTLDYQVNYWLDRIVGAKVSIEDIVGTDFVKAFYSLANIKQSRPKNVGSGIGYIISVLIMCLTSKKDDIIIVENPEIHLHPSAQAKVCEFLYFIAKSGRQLFIETHSDHLFNGIRAGIAAEEMDINDISVNFFSLDEKGCTKNTKIEFGKRGRILNQEIGLFDQFDLDLRKMIGMK